ncbi:MAG: DoxX family protein [Vicinamibacterales bacterium]
MPADKTIDMTSLGLAFLRLALAVVFVAHGANKLFGAFGGPGVGPGGLSYTAAYFASVNLEPATILALMAAVAQLAGGLLIGAGLLTRWAAIAGLAYIGVGIWKVHWKWGLFLNWTGAPGQGHGIEYSIVIGAALACLLLSGPGDFSLDGRRESYKAAKAAGRARLRKSA